MARATWVLATISLVGAATAVWMYVENRGLRAELARRPAPTAVAPTSTAAVLAGASVERDTWATPSGTGSRATSGPTPALPAEHEESRLERRQRRQQELAALLGRVNGETEDEYRARIVPLIKTGLAVPRGRVEDMRKAAEDKAHVSAEQSRQLDRAFDKVYGDVLDYTNKAIGDGVLSPYERNVAGWLEFAGGLGTMLTDVQGQIGQILSPDQVKAMSDSGFEWGEYLGVEAPWEQLRPPPPRR
jgi:hypothetical protein